MDYNPPEIFVYIFQYIDEGELIILKKINKQWLAIINMYMSPNVKNLINIGTSGNILNLVHNEKIVGDDLSLIVDKITFDNKMDKSDYFTSGFETENLNLSEVNRASSIQEPAKKKIKLSINIHDRLQLNVDIKDITPVEILYSVANHKKKLNMVNAINRKFQKIILQPDIKLLSLERILLYATVHDDIGLINFCYDHNVNHNYKDGLVFIAAAAYGFEHLVKFYINKKIILDGKGYYALRLAAINGHDNIVKYLVDAGLKLLDHHNFTTIQYVNKNNHPDIAKFLIEKFGEREFIKNNSYGDAFKLIDMYRL